MMTSTLIHKPTIQARDSRFKSSANCSPSPDSYLNRSFVDTNSSVKRGHSFSHAPKLVTRSKTYLFPGPGAHNVKINHDKNLSYTMRSKVNQPDHRSVLS